MHPHLSAAFKIDITNFLNNEVVSMASSFIAEKGNGCRVKME